MLLWAERSESVPTSSPPGWVSDWLAGRQARSEKKVEKGEKSPDRW
jgi:hypothetical protein